MKNKIHDYNVIYFNLQLVMSIITLIFFVWYLFNSKMIKILRFCVGLTLICVSLSDFKIYHKNKMGWITLIVGLLIIIYAVFKILGV